MSIGESLGEMPGQTKVIAGGVLGAMGLGTLGSIVAGSDWKPYFIAFLVMIILAVIAWFSMKAWEKVKKKRDSKRFSDDLDDGLGDDSGSDKAEQENLRRKFLEGVEEYQRAGVSVYDSPWLVLVGPPSAGKTVLLQKCGLVDAKDLQQGVGGTRGMNWWFIDAEFAGEPIHSVVLDMAGAVFMDQRQEGRWENFLKFLKRHRKYEPLNGVMLVVSVQDLLGKTPEQLAEEGGRVRSQLERIRAILDIRFPVWVIVTKCDLVDGFKEFTEAIDRAGAGQMLGWSKPGKLDAVFDPKGVKEFIDGIVDRLRTFRTKTLADMVIGQETGDRQSDRADTLYGLPGTFAELGASLQKYLEIVFARKKISTAPPFMRGIYFTSSERKGSAISKALKELGIQPTEDQWPDKSFFNKDVFGQKVFRETLLVTTADSVDRMKRRRQVIAYVSGMALAVLLAGASVWAFFGVKQTIGNVTSFYTQLDKAWEHIPTTDWTADGVRKLDISKDLTSTCTSLADVLEKSAENSGGQVSTPWVFLPIRLFGGKIGLDDDRKRIHEKLVDMTVLTPVIGKTLDGLSRPQTWRVESFDEADRFKRASEALVELVRFGNQMETATAVGGATATPGPVLSLKPLLAFLSDKGRNDKLAEEWLKSGQDARLQAVLTGTAGDALNPAKPGVLTASTIGTYRSAFDSAKLTASIRAFRDEIDSQAKGTTGLALKIRELKNAVDEAVAAPSSLGKAVEKVNTLAEYETFKDAWKKQTITLASKADDAHGRHKSLAIATDPSAALEAVTNAFSATFESLDKIILNDSQIDNAKLKKVPEVSIAVLKEWKAAFRPDKQFDAATAAQTRKEAAASLEACVPLMKVVEGDKSALQAASFMAGEVGSAIASDARPELPAGSAWVVSTAKENAESIVKDRRAKVKSIGSNAAGWKLSPDGSNSNFATRTSDACVAALDIVARRGLGQLVEQYVDRLSREAADVNALKAMLDKGGAPVTVEGLPMSRLAVDRKGQIDASMSADTITNFFAGWQAVDSGGESAKPSLTADAPIVDRVPLAPKAANAKAAVEAYRAEVVDFWEKQVPALCAPADSIKSWGEYMAGMGQIKARGPGDICATLGKLQEMHDRVIAAAGGPRSGGAPAASTWNWGALAKGASRDETAVKCSTWLGVWTELPAGDTLAARDSLSKSGGFIANLCNIPYWHDVALKGLNVLTAQVQTDLGGRCQTFNQKAGIPLLRDAAGVLQVSDVSAVKELACALKVSGGPSAAAPGSGSFALETEAPGGVSCPLQSKVRDLRQAGGECKVSPRACELATTLERGFSLRIAPGKVVAGGNPVITGQLSNLRVTPGDASFGNFKFASANEDARTLRVPSSGEVVWEFCNDQAGGGQCVKVRFKNPWHALCLIAAGDGTSQKVESPSAGTWNVTIPDLDKCDWVQVDWGGYTGPRPLSLFLSITAEGATLPAEWPTSK